MSNEKDREPCAGVIGECACTYHYELWLLEVIVIEIKCRYTAKVLYASDKVQNVREAILEAVAAKANLSGADLSGANLSGADLRSADLNGANLSGANLSGADLRSADLNGANLSGADLSGADLRSADLRSANLRSADLSGADLSGANLSGAKGLPAVIATPLLAMVRQPGVQRWWKIINKDNRQGPTYSGITYNVGEKISVHDADTRADQDCGAGINVATLEWLYTEYGLHQQENRDRYSLIAIDCKAKDIACIPTGTRGKIRLHRGTVYAEYSFDEIYGPIEIEEEKQSV